MTMSKESYMPNPLDVSNITLPDGLNPLIELVARNVHETWAQGRIDEGWTYGPVRNDTMKQHPCLVTYDDLPENEKDYDRRTAIVTLKSIIKLGWSIEKQ